MVDGIRAILDELKRLRAEGVQGIYLSDEALELARQAVRDTQPVSAPVGSDTGVTPSPTIPQIVGEKPRQTRSRVPVGEPALIDLESTRVESPASARKAASGEGQAGLPPGVAPIPEPEPFSLPEGSKVDRWNWLRDRVLNDPVCNAHLRPPGRVVFGVGSLEADIFFCGEAPGEQEALQGEPFVGPAGELLTRMVHAMGLSRESVYIGNILNWRPEHAMPRGNRKPVAVEMNYCLPYIMAQIEIVRPRVVVALGLTAVEGLLGPGPKRSMTKLRGQWSSLCVGEVEVPLLPTFHPSYLLHNNRRSTKRQVWEDMLAVMEFLGMPISEKQRSHFA